MYLTQKKKNAILPSLNVCHQIVKLLAYQGDVLSANRVASYTHHSKGTAVFLLIEKEQICRKLPTEFKQTHTHSHTQTSTV